MQSRATRLSNQAHSKARAIFAGQPAKPEQQEKTNDDPRRAPLLVELLAALLGVLDALFRR